MTVGTGENPRLEGNELRVASGAVVSIVFAKDGRLS